MLEVIGKPEGKRDVEGCSTVTISVHYQCVYEVHDIELKTVLPFLVPISNAAVYVTWPYLREICHSLTSKLGIPPIMLPSLAPPKMTSESLKADAAAEKELRAATAKIKRKAR